MSGHEIKEGQVCTSCIGGAAGMAHSLRRQRVTGKESGNHIATIFRALQQLQLRECGPSASSSHRSYSPRLEDGAAAWMCGYLDLLWESLAASVAATPSERSFVVSAAGVPTHPRTLLILQLLALEAVRREQRRATRPLSLPQHLYVPSSSSPQQGLGEAEGGVASIASPTARDSSAHLSSSYHSSCLHRSGLPVVRHWLWQRAAALPSASVVADSPYGDLSAIMIEWAALTLPAWRESPEEARWRHQYSEALHLSQKSAFTVATATPPVFGRQVEEARGGNTVKAAPAELRGSIDHTRGDLPMGNDDGPDRIDPVAATPRVKCVGSEGVASAESVAATEPRLMLASGSACPSAPRRVLRLLVRGSASSGTAQRGDVPTLEATAVTSLLSLAHDGEGMLARTTHEEQTCAPDTGRALSCTPTLPPPPLLESRGIGAASSANIVDDGGCGSATTEARSISLSCSGSKTVPFEADASATRITARPLCSAPVKGVHTKVLTRAPMLLCEDETNECVAARGSNLKAEDSSDIFCAPAVAPPGAVEDTDSCVQWRRHRWRRLASYVLHVSPGSEAEQDLCTVLEALGFVATNRGECTDSSPLEVTPLSYPKKESGELIAVQRATGSYFLQTGAARPTKPPCPLGCLPPLLAAHVWLTNTPLRSSWIAHMFAVGSSVSSPDLCGDCSGPHLEGEETGTSSSRGSQLLSSSAYCGVDTPLIAQLHDEHFPQQCIALADHRVFAVLDELLWCTESSRSFLIRFEEDLHEYLCYPLAGVCVPPAPSSAPASETGQSPAQSIHQCMPKGHAATTVHSASAPRRLTISAWRAYLELRYGRKHLGQSKHPHAPPLKTRRATQTVDSSHGDGQYAEVGDAAAFVHSTAGRPSRTEGQDMQKRIVEGGARRTRLSPFVEAAFAASSSAKGSTEAYAAIMDFAAMVFLAELRRLGATAMTEEVRCVTQALQEGHSCGGSTIWQSVSQRRSGGRNHSAVRDALQQSMTHSPAARVCAYVAPVASSVEDAVHGSSVPVCSLYALLESVLESDGTLCDYVCRWPLAPSWPRAVATPNRAHESHRSADAAPFSLLATASQLWLALVAVLTVGESSTAQYVRGVLMPPASLPAAPYFSFSSKAAATAVGETGPASETSLAPFTMPTLFRSTLEDLYHDESATAAAASAIANLDSSPCQELSVPPYASDSRSKVENAVSGGGAKSPAEATARLAAPRQGCAGAVTSVTHDTLALCAAVALRHPRVILRQLRFLWQLSSCGGDDAVMTKLSDGSRQSDTPSSSIPASSKTMQMSAAAPSATGTSEPRSPTVRASSDAAQSFKDEFGTRVGGLVECMQLASFAGLPPPLAASLIPPGPSAGTSPAGAAGVAGVRGASASAEAHGTTAPSPCGTEFVISAPPAQQCGRGGGARPPPAPSEDSMGPAIATSTSTSASTGSTTSTRLRLKLSLGSSSSNFATTAIGAIKAPSIDGEKRPRERQDMYRGGDAGASDLALLSSASETPGGSARPTKLHCIDGTEVHSMELKQHSCAQVPPPSPPPPPLASLTELRVRWSDEAEGHGGSWRLSLAPSAMTAIPGRVQGGSTATATPLPLLSLVADTLWDAVKHIRAEMPPVVQRGASDSSGDASTTATDLPATTLVLSSISRGDGKAMPDSPPPHGTLLRLRVSPAYRALQRLWQAISHPAVTERGMAASSITRGLTATWGAATRCPRLDVVCSSTTSSVPTPAVDLRVYTTLTASLRGTVCVVLGYALYESLRAIHLNWCSRFAAQHNISAQSVNCTVLPGAEQQPSCTSVSPLCESYAWLSGQLRALLENVLQPLHRILKVTVLASEKIESAGNSDLLRMVGSDSHDSRVASSLPRDITPSHRFVTAAWLTYRPIGCVLLPTLIRQLDAAMPQCRHGDCGVMGRSRHCIQAQEAWMQVKSELQHAGVEA